MIWEREAEGSLTFFVGVNECNARSSNEGVRCEWAGSMEKKKCCSHHLTGKNYYILYLEETRFS